MDGNGVEDNNVSKEVVEGKANNAKELVQPGSKSADQTGSNER